MQSLGQTALLYSEASLGGEQRVYCVQKECPRAGFKQLLQSHRQEQLRACSVQNGEGGRGEKQTEIVHVKLTESTAGKRGGQIGHGSRTLLLSQALQLGKGRDSPFFSLSVTYLGWCPPPLECADSLIADRRPKAHSPHQLQSYYGNVSLKHTSYIPPSRRSALFRPLHPPHNPFLQGRMALPSGPCLRPFQTSSIPKVAVFSTGFHSLCCYTIYPFIIFFVLPCNNYLLFNPYIVLP